MTEITINSRKHENVKLFLPPEYNLSLEEWFTRMDVFNRSPVAEPAMMIRRYIHTHTEITKPLLQISEIRYEDNSFVTDLEFSSDKAGSILLLMYTTEKLRLVPICHIENGKPGGIKCLSMTYIKEQD